MASIADLTFKHEGDVSSFHVPECVAFYNPDAALTITQQLYAELENESIQTMIADLTDISVCGTQLLTLLVTLHIRCRKLNKQLRVRSPSDFVLGVIKSTGLGALFVLFDADDNPIAT